MRLVAIVAMTLAATLPVAGSFSDANALVLCAKKNRDGEIKGTIRVREDPPGCRGKEVEIDPDELGLRGPQGEPGPQGPQGPRGLTGRGPRGFPGPASADGADGADGAGVCVPNVLASPQFVDNGDGTVTDQHTCLMWEQKTGTYDGSFINCSAVTCSDPHEVDNVYDWSSSGTAPDGAVYTDFLERVNGKLCSVGSCIGLGGHTDWRIPTVAELQSILLPLPCGTSPCIDPTFGGSTAPIFHWSATTFATVPMYSWGVVFCNGVADTNTKTGSEFVRAVRGGS